MHLSDTKNKEVTMMKVLILVVLVMVSGCSYLSVDSEGSVTVSQTHSSERCLQLQNTASAK